MRTIIIAISLLLAATSLQAQDESNVWQTLAKLTYTKQFDELLGFKVDVPVFSPAVQALEGQEIEVKGYIIPVEGYQGHTEFVFSAFPYNMCFFCGGAGPETVMEVYANEPIQYQATSIRLRGTLELNDEDINQLMYILRDAELVEE